MNISSLRERPEKPILSVSDVNLYLKGLLEADAFCRNLTVRGEISNFVAHRSGHYYFTLKDEESQIAAVMFRSSVGKMQFVPENGMKVIVSAALTVYSPGGRYQLLVGSMQPDGIGGLYLAFEQLKKKLAAEGLFSPEKKRPLPKYPKKIGVITSPTGAAIRDILHITGRRYPVADILLYPALVQGTGAEESVLHGLEVFSERTDVDVLIIGRGGGSFEDLNTFNSEKIARKLASMPFPTVSAVGHETDFTICDFVADLRAPTPSAAAELCCPDLQEILVRIDGFGDRMSAALKGQIENQAQKLDRFRSSRCFRDPHGLILDRRLTVATMQKNLFTAASDSLKKRRIHFLGITRTLSALSPLAVLDRGYSITTKNGANISSAKSLSAGDRIGVVFSDGECSAQVISVKENHHAQKTEK